jgi:hypothetical protein
MLLSAVAVGVLLNIAKQSAEAPDGVEDAPKLGQQLWRRSEEE